MSKSTSVLDGAFPCPVKGCGKAFGKKSGLVMHNNRVHLKTVKVPGQGLGWRHRRNELTPEKVNLALQLLGSEKERRKAKKRDYQREKRAENIAKGLTSGGKPRRIPMREKFTAKYGIDATAVIPAYKTKERRKEYYERHKAKMAAQGRDPHGVPWKTKKVRKASRRKIQYVYPAPKDNNVAPELPEALSLDSVRSEIINKIVDTYIDRYLR